MHQHARQSRKSANNLQKLRCPAIAQVTSTSVAGHRILLPRWPQDDQDDELSKGLTNENLQGTDQGGRGRGDRHVAVSRPCNGT